MYSEDTAFKVPGFSRHAADGMRNRRLVAAQDAGWRGLLKEQNGITLGWTRLQVLVSTRL